MKLHEVHVKSGARTVSKVTKFSGFAPYNLKRILFFTVNKPYHHGPEFGHTLVDKDGREEEIRIVSPCNPKPPYFTLARYVRLSSSGEAEDRVKEKAGPKIASFAAFRRKLKPVRNLPGWFRGPVINWQEGKNLAARLRKDPAADGHLLLVGARPDDQGHRIYLTPPVAVRELAEAFRVGEQRGMAGEETVERVASRMEKVERICPLRVTFADDCGLHAEFTSRLTKAKAARIEKLFPEDDAILDGLERYVSDYLGEGTLMATALVEEQAIHLWWD